MERLGTEKEGKECIKTFWGGEGQEKRRLMRGANRCKKR